MKAYEYFLQGREAYEKLYNNEARQAFEEAVGIDPTFAVAYLYLAWTYGRLRETAARKGGLQGSCMVSDAFFPFPDSIHHAAQAGVTAIIDSEWIAGETRSISATVANASTWGEPTSMADVSVGSGPIRAAVPTLMRPAASS